MLFFGSVRCATNIFSLVAVLVVLAGNAEGFSQLSVAPSPRPRCGVTSPALRATNNGENAIGLPRTTRRNAFGTGVAFCGMLTSLLGSAASMSANASSDSSPPSGSTAIAFRTIKLPVSDFGVTVPVSVWYPVATDSSKPLPPDVKYDYKISLRRIGQLLAKWEFIPEFVSKDFSLTPSASASSSTTRVVDGKNIPIPGTTNAKAGTNVVFLAHGYLGSRSDLGYIAEELASQGFVCVAAEYPESLEASYPKLEGLDRVAINKRLVPYVKDELVPQPILSYSAIGHSLGCGTVLQMGDDSWSRVLMGSGRAPASPSARNKPTSINGDAVYKNPVVGGRLLFISSVNDGPVNSWGGGITIPDGYTVLQESKLQENGGAVVAQIKNLDRVALVFNGEKAPNHISFLSENVNDAMLEFLSPLLPVSKALDIPVLDFDKYADSRDSVATGRVLKPLISSFLAGASEARKDSKS